MSGFVAYIDESGDEGFCFRDNGRGSSAWFALSAAITRAERDLETVRLVESVRALLRKSQRADLHFRDLKHEQRLPYLEHIARAPIRTVTVLVHKPSLDADVYTSKGRLYNYATRLLLERVSWLCRDHRREPTHTCKLVFSNRSNMSYDALCEYLALLQSMSAGSDIRIDWSAVDHRKIQILPHGKSMGLQIADAVASAMWSGVNLTGYGFTEPRYAQLLRPTVYRHRGRSIGYGLKLLPGEILRRESPHPGTEWLRDEGW